MPTIITYALTRDDLAQLCYNDPEKNYIKAVEQVEQCNFKDGLAYIDNAIFALKSKIVDDVYDQKKEYHLKFFAGFVLSFGSVMSAATLTPAAYAIIAMITAPVTATNLIANSISYYLSTYEDISFFKNNKNYLNENQKRQISKILYLYGMIHFKNCEYEKSGNAFQTSFRLHHQDQNESALIYYYCFSILQGRNKFLCKANLNFLLENENLSTQNQLLLPLIIDLLNNESIAIERLNQILNVINFDAVNHENILPLFVCMQMLPIFFDQKQDRNFIIKTFSFIELHLHSAFFSQDEKQMILKSLITGFFFDQGNEYADLKSRVMQHIGNESIKFKRDKSDFTSFSLLASNQNFYFLGRKHYGSGTTAKVVKDSYPFNQSNDNKTVVKITHPFSDEYTKNELLEHLNEEAKKLRLYAKDNLAHVVSTNRHVYLFETKVRGKALFDVVGNPQLYALFTFQNRLEIVVKLLEHMQTIWEMGAVHLDIKLENAILKFKLINRIIKDEDKEIIVQIEDARFIDYGYTEPVNTTLSSLRGTPEYIAPQMLREQQEKNSFNAAYIFDAHAIATLIAILLIGNDGIVFETKDKIKNSFEKILAPFHFHGELGGTRKTDKFWQNAIRRHWITKDQLENLTEIIKKLQTVNSVDELKEVIANTQHLMDKRLDATVETCPDTFKKLNIIN